MSSIANLQFVIVRLNGGLGNQLFQYATGRALANRLNVPLKLDISEFDTYLLRRFELNQFTITAEIAQPEELAGFVINPSRFQRTYSRLAISLGLHFSRIAFREVKFTYDDTFDRIRHPMYLNGYWQSEKYFKSNEDELRKELCLTDKLGEASQKVLEEITKCSAVSLHIRRGDYITNQSAAAIHGVCPLDYYYSAINYINSRVQNPIYFRPKSNH